jgi:hypothetical protein
LRLVWRGQRGEAGAPRTAGFKLVLTGDLKTALAGDGLTADPEAPRQVSLMTTLSSLVQTYVGSWDGLEVEGLQMSYSVRGGSRGLGVLAPGE